VAPEEAADLEAPSSVQEVGPPEVTIRYWAAARAAAGTAEERLPGFTLADVLAAARDARPDSDRLGQVLAVCAFLVGDVPVGTRDPRDVPLTTGDVVEVLPPFAGG
jgi:sulfur-carrier protein